MTGARATKNIDINEMERKENKGVLLSSCFVWFSFFLVVLFFLSLARSLNSFSRQTRHVDDDDDDGKEEF